MPVTSEKKPIPASPEAKKAPKSEVFIQHFGRLLDIIEGSEKHFNLAEEKKKPAFQVYEQVFHRLMSRRDHERGHYPKLYDYEHVVLQHMTVDALLKARQTLVDPDIMTDKEKFQTAVEDVGELISAGIDDAVATDEHADTTQQEKGLYVLSRTLDYLDEDIDISSGAELAKYVQIAEQARVFENTFNPQNTGSKRSSWGEMKEAMYNPRRFASTPLPQSGHEVNEGLSPLEAAIKYMANDADTCLLLSEYYPSPLKKSATAHRKS
jgi:hypothetical protein